MATIPDQQSPADGGTRPLRVLDLNMVSPPPATPGVGGSANGADERTPEACKCMGYSNDVPMPDNTGPTSHGGTSLGAAFGK